ncbi:MAG: PIN domain-containing protein [Bacteroidales bacterium]|nr:PIN domain-containing protein [Bacteroidales bacterium]
MEIKQKYNLKLGDSIIGATAILNDLIVVTRNEKDFKKIPDLSVLNPFS